MVKVQNVGLFFGNRPRPTDESSCFHRTLDSCDRSYCRLPLTNHLQKRRFLSKETAS
jgi:hypothetical protein